MMLFSDLVTLIADGTTQDADGYLIPSKTKTEVYADVTSVKRTEFYEALRSGITATVTFTLFAHDYGGQRLIEYDGKRYKVERTYQTGIDYIELTCSEVRRT